jgi:hypothetical protein
MLASRGVAVICELGWRPCLTGTPLRRVTILTVPHRTPGPSLLTQAVTPALRIRRPRAPEAGKPSANVIVLPLLTSG